MARDLPPSRVAPQFVVRLPDEDFRTRLADAAKANGRSMNAEIVQRLQASFQDSEGVLPVTEEPGSGTGMVWSDPEKKDAASAIYVLLDAHGYPISWEEMRTVWRALIDEEGLKAVRLEVQILTPDMESSSARAEQATALAERLRAGGKSVVLGKKKRKSELKP